MTIFLVDDDYEDHEIFKMATDKIDRSFKIISSESAIEAIDRFSKEESLLPDIIFIDVNMPRMNGKECARELRKIKRLEHLPIVLYSTHDGFKEMEEARQAGASDFMTKPASIKEFSAAVQDIITKHVTSPKN